MRHAIIVALCCVVLATLAAPAEALTVLHQRRTGGWTFTAMAKETFSACGLSIFNDEGASLALALLADGAGEISFRDPSWDLPESEVALTYWIDRKPGLQAQASVADGMAIVVLRRHDLWFDQIAAAKSLFVRVRGQVQSFDLAGLAPLVPALFDCVALYRDLRIAPAPIAAAHPELEMPAAKAQAVRWVERLAAEGAMPRATLLTSAEKADPGIQSFLGAAAIGWRNQAMDMLGRLEVFMPHPQPLSVIAWDVIEGTTADCDGDYTAKRGGRDDGVIGIYIDCAVEGRRLRRDFVLFKDRNDYLYWASFVGTRPDGVGDIDPVAEDFRRAAVTLLAQP